MLTQTVLKEILHYDPVSGVFTWRAAPTNKILPGKVAGTENWIGYVHITLRRKKYLAHRLAWLYMHGNWPQYQLDHVNRIRSDNRIDNLRECSNSENHQNSGIYSNNMSGYPGVFWNKKASKWAAQIMSNGDRKFLGYFSCAESARDAYLDAKKKFHPFYIHH